MDNKLWLAEFRGFFYGEGSVEISAFTRKSAPGWTGYRPRLRVTLRADELPVLLEFQKRFGGFITKHAVVTQTISHASGQNYKANPRCAWELVGNKAVRPVLEILKAGVLPARKRGQVAILEKYLDLIGGAGHKFAPGTVEKIEALRAELRQHYQYS